MKKCHLWFAFILCGTVLYANSYQEQMIKAEKLFKAKKYKEAAETYEEAILENVQGKYFSDRDKGKLIVYSRQ